jgi:hypothetical protein
MHNPSSREVVALALNRKPVSKTTKLSSIELLSQHGVYWHSVTSRFKSPPTYLAFYYDSKLQSIHHVEDCEEVSTAKDSRLLGRQRAKAPKFSKPTLVFKLGAAVQPRTDIPVGKVFRGQEMPCSLLHLFTSPTVKAAWLRSAAKKRAA